MIFKHKPKVAIIVLTYNGEDFITPCLSSITTLNTDGLDVRLYAVDNASHDSSVQMVKTYPDVTLIENEHNDGYAGGNNVGMRRAIEEGAEYVYLLNQDAWLDRDALQKVVSTAESDSSIGSVQSMLLLDQDHERINSAGNAIHFLGFGYCVGYNHLYAEWPHTETTDIAYASGACVLYRVSALEEVGLLDEKLFLYHEDLDLGWRLSLARYRNVLAPDSLAYHHYEFSRSIMKFYYMERNRYIVLWKNLQLLTIFVLLPFLFVTEVMLFLVSIRSGWWMQKLRAYLYFIRPDVWWHIISERRELRNTRKVSDREIVRAWTPVIAYQQTTSSFTRYVANPLMRVTWAVLRRCIL